MTLSSAGNLCKQFGPRSGPTECQACSGSKLFDTDSVLKELFEKINFEKNYENYDRNYEKHEKLPSMQSVKLPQEWPKF